MLTGIATDENVREVFCRSMSATVFELLPEASTRPQPRRFMVVPAAHAIIAAARAGAVLR